MFEFTFTPCFDDSDQSFAKQKEAIINRVKEIDTCEGSSVLDFLPDLGQSLSDKFLTPKIVYDYNMFPSNDQALMLSSPSSYCLKQCNKIGFYLQKIHSLEIIRMKVTFF